MIFRSDTVSFSTVQSKGGGGGGGGVGGGGCQQFNDIRRTPPYNEVLTSENLLSVHKGNLVQSDENSDKNDKKKTKGRSGWKKKEKYEVNPKKSGEAAVNLRKLLGRRHSTKIYDDGGIWKGADSDSLMELPCFNTGSNTDIHHGQRCVSSTV